MTRPDPLKLLGAATLTLALMSAPILAQTDGDESEEQVHEAVTDQDPETQPEVDEADRTDVEPEDENAGMGEAVDPETAVEEPPTAEDTAQGEAEAEPASEGEADAEAGTTATGDGPAADALVATIDGQSLTLGELIALRRDLPEQYQALPDEVLMQGLTEQLVDQTLLAAAAREAGMDERADVALSLKNQERAVLADAYLQAEMNSRVTADALRTAYEAQYVDADPEAEIRAAHILVDSQEKAAELRDQLDGGADFAKLAEEHGTDGTASRGGDLGWFGKGDMVPSFGEAAFALEPGQIGGPVESPFGWHLIRVDEKRDRPVPEFAEVEGALLEKVTAEAQAAIVQELREGATVELSDPLPAESIRNDALVAGE